jgi:hypothetical protein
MVSGRAIPHWAGQTIPWPTIFEVIEASKGVLICDEVDDLDGEGLFTGFSRRWGMIC